MRRHPQPLSAATESPEINIVLFGFLLNYPWEMIQSPLFEGERMASHWDAVKTCTKAAAGDSLILLVSYWAIAAAARNRWWFVGATAIQKMGFVAIGLAITIVLERLATSSLIPGWGWSYSEVMPVVPGLDVAAVPLLQWAILPLLAIWLVRRQLSGSAPSG